ncbi:phage antirepressor KilAC domain-containing protein [Paenibacillus terrae]|uniref:phage antirepressor KilAC domain-containing protein n=1 Tax=Paenibacillus terrae TaxID=159743 RepID=UPI0011EAFB14|nr:phage antirepressor KilAC domain-containing protein [Paenibacillus terrae]
MEQLTKVFNYGECEVRTVVIEGEPWFVAQDISAVLGFRMASDMTRILDEDEKDTHIVRTPGGEQKLAVINEPGLYTAILRSRKSEAREFKRWITHEVIPSIRRNGMYATDTLLDDPELFLKTVTRLTEERKARLAAETRLTEQAPKVRAFDTFMTAEGTQTMNEVAKALSRGRNKLFAELRSRKVLMANNKPYQRYIDAGYFTVKETTREGGGRVMPFSVTLVTPKGVAYIERLLVDGAEVFA